MTTLEKISRVATACGKLLGQNIFSIRKQLVVGACAHMTKMKSGPKCGDQNVFTTKNYSLSFYAVTVVVYISIYKDRL